ncbi:MAG: matrixin family metalloprotease [Nitrososphaeraceae archaeon]
MFFKISLFIIIVMSVFIALPAIDVHNYNHQVEAKKSKSVRSFGHGNNDLSNNEQSIQICCGWGANKISGEGVTYRIIGGNAMTEQAVHSAIDDWTRNIEGLRFNELDSSDTNADITLKFNSKFSQDGSVGHMKLANKGISLKAIAPGATRINYNLQNGMITDAVTTISKSIFGDKLDFGTTEQIAKHELGHALGLGHANFNGDLMSPTLNDESTSISKCDIDAVLDANHMSKDDKSDGFSADSFRCT